MGQKLKIWATMTSLILLSGMLGFGSSADAVELPSEGQAADAKGCEKSDPRSQACASNPHSDGAGGTIETSPCNGDSNGVITPQELVDAGVVDNLTDAENAIIAAEGGPGGNVIIDTQAEYDALKATLTEC